MRGGAWAGPKSRVPSIDTTSPSAQINLNIYLFIQIDI